MTTLFESRKTHIYNFILPIINGFEKNYFRSFTFFVYESCDGSNGISVTNRRSWVKCLMGDLIHTWREHILIVIVHGDSSGSNIWMQIKDIMSIIQTKLNYSIRISMNWVCTFQYSWKWGQEEHQCLFS